MAQRIRVPICSASLSGTQIGENKKAFLHCQISHESLPNPSDRLESKPTTEHTGESETVKETVVSVWCSRKSRILGLLFSSSFFSFSSSCSFSFSSLLLLLLLFFRQKFPFSPLLILLDGKFLLLEFFSPLGLLLLLNF